MLAFLDLLRDKYGGVDSYCRKYISLSDEDLAIIRSNIVIPQMKHSFYCKVEFCEIIFILIVAIWASLFHLEWFDFI